MKHRENVELTNLCLIYRDDEILLQNRVSRVWHGWTLPGGHIDEGESFVDSVKREVKEETGLELHSVALCGLKQFPNEDGTRYIVVMYKSNDFSGELTSSAEGEMRWLKRSELDGLATVADFKLMLEVFDNDSLSEFQYTVDNNEWTARIK